MVVADTEYCHRAISDILPLRDAFVSIFLVSLGILFNPRVVLDHPWMVAALFLGFTVGKAAIATLAALAMKFPSRVAWLAGVGLAQFGEFWLALAGISQKLNVIDDAHLGHCWQPASARWC